MYRRLKLVAAWLALAVVSPPIILGSGLHLLFPAAHGPHVERNYAPRSCSTTDAHAPPPRRAGAFLSAANSLAAPSGEACLICGFLAHLRFMETPPSTIPHSQLVEESVTGRTEQLVATEPSIHRARAPPMFAL